jgi:carboxypeptidase Taq
MHVILRFELEQDIFAGRLAAKDIPEAWDAKMRDYLGLPTIDNPKDGPMQDVHWPSGGFGYFPSYTLGALLAAQQGEAMRRAHPALDDDMRVGDFTFVNTWRRKNIWSKASTLPTPDLIAAGEALSAKPFMRHLEARYLS